MLVVNAIEAEMLGGGRVTSLESAAQAAAALASTIQSGCRHSWGRRSRFLRGRRSAATLPGLKVKVASTHGAGDTFMGVLAARLALGEAMTAALTIANQEAAKVVSTPESARAF